MTQYSGKKALVVGGGLAGTSTAYSLAKRGWSISLVEKEGSLAAQASGNKAGIFMPMITNANDPIGHFYLEAFYYAVQHFQTLEIQTKVLKWNQCGVLDLTEKKVAKDPKKTVLSLELIAKVSEKLASNLAGVTLRKRAMFLPDSGYINPASLCFANIEAQKKNISIETGREVNSLNWDSINNVWQVFDNEGKTIGSFDIVVLTNAIDALNIEQSSWLPLRKVRGQVTYFPETEKTRSLKMVLCGNGYITPSIEGIHYLGATFDRNDDDTSLRKEDHDKNINNIRQYIDIEEINTNSIEGRVAFRTASTDRRPIVGALPNYNLLKEQLLTNKKQENVSYPGLYVSLAHGSRGIVSAPIAGEYLAALVEQEDIIPSQHKELLSPERFVVRDVVSLKKESA